MQHLFNNHVNFERSYEIANGFPPYPVVWANIERLNLTNVVGTFVAHETITGGTSEATAKLGIVGDGYLEIYERSDTNFQAGEAIAGGTSEATAKVDSIKSLINVPCCLQPFSGRERFVAGKTTVFATHKVFIGVPSVAITEKDRVKFGTRNFNIELIKNYDEADLYYRLELLEIKD